MPIILNLLSRYWLHLLVVGMVAYAFKHTYDSGVNSERDRWEKKAYQATISAYEAAGKFTSGVLTDHKETQDNGQTEINLLKAQLAAADRAYDGLHNNTKAFAKRAADSSRAAANCKATESALGVLADMLKESDRLAGIYAKEADDNRIRLNSCGKAYNDLKKWFEQTKNNPAK